MVLILSTIILSQQNVWIVLNQDFVEKQETPKTNLNEFFYVGNVAGRDVTINNITANIYLQALEIAIKESNDLQIIKRKI